MVVTIDLDQEPILLNSKPCALFCFHY